MKSHLSGHPKNDVLTYESVPDDVNEAALEEAIQGANKKRRTMLNSSIGQQIHDPVPLSSRQEICKQVGDHVRDGERMAMRGLKIEQEVGDGRTACSDEVPNHTEHDSEQPVPLFKTRGDLLPTRQVIGKEFETHLQEIWSWLMNDNVSMIGIYGMAGVGKSELAKHINNKLLISPAKYSSVHWITVSPDFSIRGLQKSIAKAVDMDLSSVDDESIRAARLSEAFVKTKNSVLILDDVWNYIPINKVGIPVGVEGCRLVLTTSSLDVCQKMRCQKKVKVNPISEEEAWELFMEELGQETVLTPETKGIAESIVKECQSLPLGIEVMARNMRGVEDICEWRNALKNLERAIRRPENMELFLKLRRGYDNLNDSALKQCFLYCALFPKCYSFGGTKLIDYWIDEGIIKGKKSRQEEFDEGKSMLHRLQNVCLLENSNCWWKMHSLIRHMALQIMEESTRAIVQAGVGLKELPDKESWTEDLVRVSLVDNSIKEIPPHLTPSCPNLLTLLLCANSKLRWIPDYFFMQLYRLKVLDLSDSKIEELPSSISYLVSLCSLLLKNCKKLRYVPSLAELRVLKRLDLFMSSIEQVPEEMELLSNLTYLNLYGTEIEALTPGILPKLCRLQVLLLDPRIAVEGEEIACLEKLETLMCRFEDVGEFNKFVPCMKDSRQLSKYSLYVGDDCSGPYFPFPDPEDDFEFEEGFECLQLSFCGKSCGNGALFIPDNIDLLRIENCHIGRRFRLEKLTKLKDFSLESCYGIECLISFTSHHSIAQSHDEVGGEETVSARLPATIALNPSHATFSHLERIRIIGCHGLKRLFPYWMLSNLQNLEQLFVWCCNNLEEIIVMEEQSESHDFDGNSLTDPNIQVSLPKVREFCVRDLPKLKSICSGKLMCKSLWNLQVINCVKLKWIPLSLVYVDNDKSYCLPSLEYITVGPKEWWEGLQWEDPNIKNLISPLCEFWID